MPNVGPTELIVVLVVALLVLGPKRLPEAGRSLGRGIREFKDSITGLSAEVRAGQLDASSAEAAPVPVGAKEPGRETDAG
jgi:sec-independent protein translocase protein TatA